MTAGKRCPLCEMTKPYSEFYSDGAAPYCKPCTKADVRRWQKENPERFARTQRRSRLKCQYGMTEERYEQMFSEQGGCCAICSVNLSAESPHIDHCHDSGRVRGILCPRCNRTMGLFGDDPVRLRKAAAYLRAAAQQSQ